MNDITISTINIKEVLKYLGYKGGKIEQKYIDEINSVSEVALNIAKPKYCYSEFPIEIKDNGVNICGTTLFLEGKDIKNHLSTSKSCILLGATIGLGVDKFLRENAYDVKNTLIFDCCASDIVERLCDEVEDRLRKEKLKDGLYLTPRFSCGYGDLSIQHQKDFVNVLNATRQIGLTVSSSNLLIPTKSVTAIMGVGEKQGKKPFSCDICFLRDTCSIRKAGGHCGK